MIAEYGLGDSSGFVSQVRTDFPRHSLHIDQTLRFSDYHEQELRDGEMTNTIRFKAKAPGSPRYVRVPLRRDNRFTKNRIDCFIIDLESSSASEYRLIGTILIPRLLIAHVEDFPEHVSFENGYEDNEHMRKGISRLYQRQLRGRELKGDDLLSAYYLEDFIPTQ